MNKVEIIENVINLIELGIENYMCVAIKLAIYNDPEIHPITRGDLYSEIIHDLIKFKPKVLFYDGGNVERDKWFDVSGNSRNCRLYILKTLLKQYREDDNIHNE